MGVSENRVPMGAPKSIGKSSFDPPEKSSGSHQGLGKTSHLMPESGHWGDSSAPSSVVSFACTSACRLPSQNVSRRTWQANQADIGDYGFMSLMGCLVCKQFHRVSMCFKSNTFLDCTGTSRRMPSDHAAKSPEDSQPCCG